VSAVVVLVGLSTGFQSAILALFEKANVDLLVIRKNVAQRSTSSLDQSIREELATLPGVQTVEPILLDLVSFEDAGLPAVQIYGATASSQMVQRFKVRGDAVKDDDKNTIMLGYLLADLLHKKIGDTLDVEGEPIRVVGIYQSSSLMEDNSGFMSLSALQRLLGREGQVTSFLVSVKDTPDRKELVEKVRAEIETLPTGPHRKMLLKAMTKEEHVNTAMEIRLVHALVWATSGVALVLGAIGVLNTMMMSVAARTREIGVMRAVGWRPWRVTVLILSETAILCLFGAVLGTLLGVGGTWILSVLPLTKSIIPQVIYPSVILTGSVLAFIAGLLGGAYPALMASRMLPCEALRHE
jgi:putative ABC transport system permease protein